MYDLTLEEIMSTDIVGVPVNVPAQTVLEQMWHKKVSCIFALDNKKPVGILTERAVARRGVSGFDFSQATMKDMMNSPITTAPMTMTLPDACQILGKNGYRHLPVVDGSNIIKGVVTLSDIVDGLGFDFFCSNITVDKVMTPIVETVHPDTSLLEAAAAMVEKGHSCIVVAHNQQTKADYTMGIITERDVARLILGGLDLSVVTVAQAMNSPVDTVPVSATVDKAVMYMKQKGIRRLVVTYGMNNVAGLLTQSNIIRWLTAK